MSKIRDFPCYILIILLVCLPAGIGCNRFQKPLGTSDATSDGTSDGTSADMIRPSRPKHQLKATVVVRPPRNVLLITIDTLRADHLSCYGYTGIKTPNIDALAKEGVRFEWAFTPVPITLPSHASIMTGMYPASHGVLNNGEYRLDSSIKTLAQILRQHRLATAAFVGAFVLSRQFGLDQGFEKYDDALRPTQESKHEAFSLYNERKGEMVTEASIQWLKKENPDRFFLWVHYFDPHFPYDPPQAFKSAYPDHPYDGEIAYTDHCVGLLLKELADRRVLDDTLVVLVADHGESLGEHRETTHGIFLYDATVRVPLILHYPGLHYSGLHYSGLLPQGSVFSQPVKTLDILPTVLDLLKIPHPAGLQGKSLLTYPAAPAKSANSANSANPADPAHSDDDSYPLQVSDDAIFLETRFPEANFGWSRLEGVRTRRWKYIRAPHPELYDLSSDPHELHNVLAHCSKDPYPKDHYPKDPYPKDPYPKEAQRLEKMLQSFLAPVPWPTACQMVEMDAVTRKRLQGLGYVQTSRTAAQTDANLSADFSANLRDLPLNLNDLTLDPNDLPRDPKDMIETLALFDRGSEEYSKGQYQSAIDSFRQLTHQDTKNILARFLLAAALEKVNLFEESLKEFQEVARQDTRFINVHNNLGNIYERLDKYEQALTEYQTDIRLHPDNPLSYNNLGVIYLKHRLYQEAREQFKKLLLLNPDLPTQVVAHTNLGIAFEMLGLYDNSQVEYQISLQLDPRYVAACMGLGNIFLKKNKLDQAILEWQKALEINPQNAEAHFDLGCTFMKQNRLDKAAEHLQEAIQLEPNLWQARTLLEQCRQQKSSPGALAPPS